MEEPMTRTLPLLTASLFLVASGYAQNHARESQHHDPHVSGPQMRTEIDNETVQVLRIHLGPHEKVPMHDVTPRVVVWLTDAHLRATLENGATREERGTAGQVDWVPAQRHAAENLDDHAIEFIAILSKPVKDSPHRAK
jgi:hypothetical protein